LGELLCRIPVLSCERDPPSEGRPVGLEVDYVRPRVAGKRRRTAAIRVHDIDVRLPSECDLGPIGRPGWRALRRQAIAEARLITPVSIHDVDLRVDVGIGPVAVAHEGDLRSIWRPGRGLLIHQVIGETRRVAPVSIHDVDLVVGIRDGEITESRERDLAVGREYQGRGYRGGRAGLRERCLVGTGGERHQQGGREVPWMTRHRPLEGGNHARLTWPERPFSRVA
jgi:hypothetical protein